VLLIKVLLTASLCTAQAPAPPAPGSPEEIAGKAADAASAGRFDDFGKLMDPESLKAFHDGFTGVFDEAEKAGKQELIGQVLPALFGVKTLDQFRGLEDGACFVSFMRANFNANPVLRDALARGKNEILGRVDEAKNTTHVVCRMTLGPAAGESGPIMSVISLRKVDQSWRMLLSGDVDALMAVMRQAISGKRPDAEPRRSSSSRWAA
jgi:hypothetical protein